ncbi:hypothetical protein ASPZODRAFT_143607 [Penicilliopsis zonata CBS 506.65]|uniref:Transporter n=1 Tax=Penicilliopsis zonata CBS 506.65 TaxID=1073090 RepID=A0A1L9SES3_9EURO|nr:hypothetical protein ASPZODRAFT_143607 [Penicilliopsis zonata CBS 506.65]OJJ45720.1 hypothetical protein ASPZODRAFT_143607 [Penicilliopsis zonata CBS 506.65]
MAVNATMTGVYQLEPVAHANHPSFLHLVLLVFEAVLEVVCVSLPGYIAARQGMFDADAQKLVANLNVMLFTPCLIFTKLGSQLTAEKLTDLAIIPVIFVIQTCVSYGCAFVVARICRFKKRQSNFVAAMAVFGNSNSLPISLVMSLSQTLKGLHWSRVPNDNDDEVAARGILYLLIFQQLGQLVRWSWGYHVLLAPKERYLEEQEQERGVPRIQRGQARYSDNPNQTDPDEPLIRTRSEDDFDDLDADTVHVPSKFGSGDQTPVTTRTYSHAKLSSLDASAVEPGHIHGGGDDNSDSSEDDSHDSVLGPPPEGPFLPRQVTHGDIMTFPNVEVTRRQSSREPTGASGWGKRCKKTIRRVRTRIVRCWHERSSALFQQLPPGVQKALTTTGRWLRRTARGVWAFMNPPLWAMLVAIVVASVPALQRLFFDDGTFVRNSVTRAVQQNGQVAVPLILVVLGANLARNTIPEEALADLEHPKEERKLIIASLVARMLLPTLFMAPILALLAKFVPISILGDPIFIVVCFLLTGAPSALQLAQICQINNVYVGAMSSLLFQSYVVWSD